jgi:hypothetical protein
MKVLATRESVAMGDDVDAPHEQVWQLPGPSSLRGVLTVVARDRYLPTVGLSVWVARSVGGVPLAVMAVRWREPQFLPGWQEAAPSLMDAEGTFRLHFDYRAQDDPQAVYDELCEARP